MVATDGWVRLAVGEVVRCGPAALVVRALPRPDTPRAVEHLLATAPSGAVPFFRPPTDLLLADDEPLDLPEPPGPRRRPTLSLLTLILPIGMAIGLVLLTGQWLFALIILAMPLLLLVQHLVASRRSKTGGRRRRARWKEDLAALEAELAVRHEAEVRRRRALHPDPVEVVRRATMLGERTWERRPPHPQRLEVSVGLADLPWRPSFGQGQVPAEAVEEKLAAVGTLPDVPLTATLAPGTIVGLAGDRAAAVAVAASLIVQAATLHGPADLRIAVLAGADREEAWEWSKWLPHAAATVVDRPPLLLTGTPSADDLEDLLVDAGPDAVVLLVLDAEDRPHVTDAAVRTLVRAHPERVAGLALATAPDGLPAQCDPVVELEGPSGEGTCRWPGQGGRTVACTAIGLDGTTAESCARSLARLTDPDVGGGGGALPALVSLADVLELRTAPPGAVAARWSTTAGLPVLLGAGADGPVVVDLSGEGASLGVLGSRGSGKTELLVGAVVSLAAAVAPEAVAVVLWGGGFRSIASLPHVATATSATDDEGASRVVEALDREVQRRERLAAPPAPLLLVLDDVDVLGRSAPQALDALVRVVRRGRGVGLHLLCATSRGSGPGVGDLFDLAAVRVALRVGTTSESLETVGTEAAAHLDRAVPGRGLVAVRRGEPRVVQVAASTVGVPAVDDRVDITPFTLATARTTARRRARRAPDVGALVALVVDAGAGHARPFDLLRDRAAAEGVPASPDLPSLLGIDDVRTFDPARTWTRGTGADLLRVPIGVDLDGRPVVLDLKESALDGMGPHGLLVGATGSGKSELLRTLVTGLAINHHPEALAMVLVDFKGGANFAVLGGLPHVAGLITNLASDLALVDRVLAALHGEQRRRQELLAQAGNLASIREHRAARAAGADLEPLPELLVVVDEFAELLEQQPDFIDFFLTIGRVGRSLGIHLLLASQRLEEGRLRGLDTYLSYRLGLRTFSAIESRTVLGVPDAYSLPQAPGGGYLKVGTDRFDRFQAACVTVPVGGGAPSDELDTADTVVGAAAARLVGAAPRAHQIWLAPLPPAVALNELLGPEGFATHPTRGFLAHTWPGIGRLVVPAGVVDEPELQRQSPLVLDLAGAHANLAVVGAPQTGKSTLLRTILLSLLVTHTPEEVNVYVADLGGGTLDALTGAPHVGCVATRLEPDRVRRLVGHVESVLSTRERLFKENGIDSVATFRARRADASLPPGDHADVFLVVDGWASIRAELPELEPALADLAARGNGYGIHLVLAANRWTEIRANVLETIPGKLELRLGNPAESEVDRRRASTIRPDATGRGLLPGGHLFQAALPRLDGERSVEHLHAATKLAVDHLAAPWTGPVAPPVLLLPGRVDPSELPAADAGPPGVPVGLSEVGLTPLWLDLFAAEPHLLVFGDTESGKTTFLRALCQGLVARSSPQDVQLLVVDHRRTLLDVVPPAHLLSYGASEPATRSHVDALRRLLDDRLPGADVTAAQLRDRSWWTGPEIVVIVDDYDLVTGPMGGPLSPLADLIAQGRDVGFHLVLAHRVAGAQKALFEQVLGRVREVSGTGLILAGDRDEGPLLAGVRAGPQPPGRGVLVRRRQPPVLVQIVDAPAPED